MTRFAQVRNSFRPTQDTTANIHDTIPVGTYLIDYDKDGFFLTGTDDFTLPKKIYGNSTSNSDRILNTFLSRTSSTGVLLSGQKGSGKTLLAKQISIEAHKHNIPTFIVNSPYCGDAFNVFLSSFHQPVVVVFDEFEKVYDMDSQNSLLTLFDGTFSQKKLFILTSNRAGDINNYFKDRPGRIYYWLEFNKLEDKFVIDYCDDNLNDNRYQQQIVNLCGILGFNFDMLQAVVQEMNMYNESPQDAMRLLNVNGEVQGYGRYDYTVHEESNPNEPIFSGLWSGVPINANSDIAIKEVQDEDGDTDWEHAPLSASNIMKSDFNNGKYTFKVSHEGISYIIKMTKQHTITATEYAYTYSFGN
jgi:hypothetical protein